MAIRKPKKTDDHFIKSLNPRDADTKYMGDEPFFPLQPDEDQRTVALTRSFTWYNRFYNKKDAKELLCQFLESHNRIDEAKKLRKLDEREYFMTLCWLARMTMRGLELSEHENSTLENEIARLSLLIHKPEIIEKVDEDKTNNRPNIQEIMREKARDAAGELEGVFDVFYTSGKSSTKIVDIVARFNVMSQHIPIIVEVWKKKQTEFETLNETDDKELKEAYGKLGKIQLRNILKFIEGVLGDLNSYISIKKASKAPRKKKAVPVEKIVARLKYLKEFKDPVNKLDLLSIHPTKLHGASECYLYDTVKRKLVYLVADEYSKSFTVKGPALLGIDTNKCQAQTLR